MKVLHLSTWEEVCGIATYTSNLVNSLELHGIYNEVYPVRKTELEYFTIKEIKQHFAKFCEVAKDFDVIHIQHEHSFFHGSYPLYKSIQIFNQILSTLKKNNKPVVVTFHTDPIFSAPIYSVFKNSLGLKRTVYSAIQNLNWKTSISNFFNDKKDSYKAVLHSKRSRLLFIKSGFSPESVLTVKHGITERKNITERITPKVAKEKLGLPVNSKILSIFGFVSSYKGYEVAIKSLKYLPEDYYLAIIGGSHPYAKNDTTVDHILNIVFKYKLENRVIITGFVDFDVLDVYHAATDICLAPYVSDSLSASGALTWALNSGKPIIASKIPAFYELNQEAKCMVMTTPSCSNELAWQINKLYHNKQLQKQVVTNSLNYVKNNSWNNTAKSIVDLYSQFK